MKENISSFSLFLLLSQFRSHQTLVETKSGTISLTLLPLMKSDFYFLAVLACLEMFSVLEAH